MTKTHWLCVTLLGLGAACTNAADPTDMTLSADMSKPPPDDGGTVSPPPVVQSLVETPIVTSDPDSDPTLVNAWGLAFNPNGFAWVVANGSGVANVYTAAGPPARLVVTIPSPTGATSAPTGEVFNQNAADFTADKFLFATEDGTIAGWQSGTTATIHVDNSDSGAVYKGIAIVNTTELHPARIYATNFNAGTVDVFDTEFKPVDTARFIDKGIPSGFAPFNVAVVERDFVIVTYALQNDEKHDDVAGPGNGFVDVFDLDGRFVTRLISEGVLNSPWGLAFPPESFGNLFDTLLVGNFGDGRINAFQIQGLDVDDSVGGDKRGKVVPQAKLLGVVGDPSGNPLFLDGLWSLQFGVDAGGFSSKTLYFTAGPAMESQGIFGMLTLP
jgi:uncharacterized protein (TIGR03118 family)